MKEIKTTDELMNMYNYLTEKAKDIDPTNCLVSMGFISMKKIFYDTGYSNKI